MKNHFLTFSIIKLFTLLFVINIYYSGVGQGLTSSIGDRENIGIFGGPAVDLTYVYTNQRIFAGVHSPATLLYSDDTGQTWSQAFPFDSLEYSLETRGWGGGVHRVLSNQKGWVAAHTGYSIPEYSSAVISFDGGNTFKTAFDSFLLNLLTNESKPVTAIALSDHFLYAALDNYLVRMNDTTSFYTNQLLLNIDTIPGVLPESHIAWISVSNDVSGYPIYFITESISGTNQLFKYYNNVLMELFPPSSNNNVLNVFTHPGQATGDTVFICSFNSLTQEKELHKSFSGGFFWSPVYVSGGITQVLSDADYSPDWVMPLSNGLRLSFPGGLISDDLGISWQGPGLIDYGIATHPLNANLILGSDNVGVTKSQTGINGPFDNTDNIGFNSVNVNQFALSQADEICYVATDAGLAYTQEYFNPLIIGYDQWISTNGLFPVPNTGDEEGVTAVAIDPANGDHVICGYKNGFNITFTGPNDFMPVTPYDWNNNTHLDPYVTDIKFVTSNIVVATTGMKFKGLVYQPSQPVGNIWRSTDGGQTWSIVTPANPPPDDFQMGNCLSVGYNGPQTIIYAGTGYNNGLIPPVSGSLWGSYDNGDSWSRINDAPIFGGGLPLPIYDIDIDPANSDIIYLSANHVFARSDDGGLNYFFTDVPYNTGSFTSALIDPVYPDSITVTAGRHIYKYNYLIDDADLKFKGMPGEFFTTSDFGSLLGGSNTGGSKITEATTYFLNLKVYIEGPFNGTDMNTDLNTLEYLPLSQPFNQPPWNYQGTESVSSIPSLDIVDWVLVELRKTTGDSSTATAEKRFDRQAAFLLKDGSIVDDDGFTEPRFSIILSETKENDKVHALVLTPSHTGERTADSLSQSKSSTFSYDFTTGADRVYGGKNAHKELATGIWGMMSGDGNHNGQVDNVDKDEVWLPQNGNSGYLFGDFNRDGTVDDTDIDDYWKPNAGRGNKVE